MIKLPFNDAMIASAREKAMSLGSINNSILKGGGNIAGYLGEEALAPYVGAKIVSNNRGLDKYNHDLLLECGHRLEVKTKRRTVSPRSHYDVSIAETSKHQKPDLYGFISLEFDRCTKSHPKKYYGLKNIWLCGFMGSFEYWERASLWESGRIDKTNSFKTHVNMYNLPIRELHDSIWELIE
mgnify:FL=1|tara:strand:+ start:9908 stop:10453 length:546 start_codon:yes stop_codon:yes gene_type:complete